MSRTQQVLSWSGLAALLGLFVTLVTGSIKIGQHDAVTEAAISRKLDTERFVKDSVTRDVDRVILKRIDDRVQAMYCAGKPPGCR